MDLIALILFVLVAVGRAYSETKRKQEGQSRKQPGSRRAGPWELPAPTQGSGPFGGPWNRPPVLQEEKQGQQTLLEEKGLTPKTVVESRLQPLVTFAEGEGTEGTLPDRYQEFLEGMGAEGSESSEGPGRPAETWKEYPILQRQRKVMVIGKEEVVRGIVMAEILGLPRARRPFGR